MNENFEQILADINYQTCKTSYANYEVIIRDAFSNYITYLPEIGGSNESLYEFTFLDGCLGGQCEKAT